MRWVEKLYFDAFVFFCKSFVSWETLYSLPRNFCGKNYFSAFASEHKIVVIKRKSIEILFFLSSIFFFLYKAL